MVMVFTDIVRMPIAVTVMVVIASTQNPCTCDVHGKSEAGNGDCLSEVNWHRRKKTAHGLVANKNGNHRKNYCTGEPG